MMQIPRKHHTVPESYLKGFLSPESRDLRLHKFSKKNKRWGRISPCSATMIRDHYMRIAADGQLDPSLELGLNKYIESPAIEPLRKLSSGQVLTDEERLKLSRFIGVMMVRTVKMSTGLEAINEEFRKPESVISRLTAQRERYVDVFGVEEVDKYIQTVKSRGYGIELPKSFYLERLSMGETLGDALCSMDWQLERAVDDCVFITSDHPAFAFRKAYDQDETVPGINRGDLGVQVLFPLTAKLCLLINHDGLKRRKKATKPRVDAINRRIAANAVEYVFAPVRTLDIESVVESTQNVMIPHLSREQIRHTIFH